MKGLLEDYGKLIKKKHNCDLHHAVSNKNKALSIQSDASAHQLLIKWLHHQRLIDLEAVFMTKITTKLHWIGFNIKRCV